MYIHTCAIDAEPSGLSSNSRKRSDSSAPFNNSFCTISIKVIKIKCEEFIQQMSHYSTLI